MLLARSHRQGPVTATRQWPWAALGAGVGALVVGLASLPASWLAGAIREGTAGQVVLADARGTLWTGSGQLVLSGGEGSRASAALPDRLSWRLRPALTGLMLDVQADCCTPAPLHWQIGPRWGGWRLTLADSRSQWPALVLAGLGAPWNTLQAEGRLDLVTNGLSVEWAEGRTVVAGRAELTARDISSRLSTLRPMGSYRFIVTGGSTATLQLETLEGSLQLSGQGQWVGSRLRFQGEATAAPEREAALSNLLNIIGRRQGARSIITVG